MCSPISLIMSEDNCFFPANDCWNHSHTDIATLNNLSTSLFGDKYARVEVRPKNNILRNTETNEILEVDDSWNVVLDEERTPGFWKEDRVNQENRAREYAKKWLKNFDKKYLIPVYREIGGNNSKLTGGNYSTLIAGSYSTLTGGHSSALTCGNYSELNGGDCSRLIGGDCSILTGGNYSTLTGGNGSTFCAGKNSSFSSTYWDGQRYRTITFYVGENGILPDKKYKIVNVKIYDNETGEEVKEKKTLKRKSNKKKVTKKNNKRK